MRRCRREQRPTEPGSTAPRGADARIAIVMRARGQPEGCTVRVSAPRTGSESLTASERSNADAAVDSSSKRTCSERSPCATDRWCLPRPPTPVAAFRDADQCREPRGRHSAPAGGSSRGPQRAPAPLSRAFPYPQASAPSPRQRHRITGIGCRAARAPARVSRGVGSEKSHRGPRDQSSIRGCRLFTAHPWRRCPADVRSRLIRASRAGRPTVPVAP